MDITQLLFYGGIAGLGLTVVLATIVVVALIFRKRNLLNKLELEYGKDIDK